MTEFSSMTRVLTTLVLAALSVVLWRWLQASPAVDASTKPGRATASEKKKPTKKKPAKKKKKATENATTEVSTTATTAVKSTVAAPTTTVATNGSSDGDDSSDEDAGLSAKQVLARRRFKPKAIGGQSAAAAAAAVAEAVSAARFHAGQRVVARFQNGSDWFPGVILEVRRGNEYHVKYDDGEVEHHVPHAHIQDEAAAAVQKAADETVRERLHADTGDEADSADSSSHHDGDDGDGDESEDGWQVVEKKRRAVGGAAPVEVEKVDAEGLTKRQRENRRKKERQKEVKEMVRAQAQENGLHARWGGTMTRLKYVPPPSAHAPPS